jgi:hypothetical protein
MGVQVVGSGGQTVNAVGQATMAVQAAVVRIVGAGLGGGSGSGLFAAVERLVTGGTVTLAATDGILGGNGTIDLPLINDQPSTPQAFIISAFGCDLSVIPHVDDGAIFDVDNQTVVDITVAQNTAIILLRYLGVWRVVNESPPSGGGPAPTGSGVTAASVVLYCPTLTAEDLTPTDGDTMYWVEHTPGLDANDPMTGLSDWTGREEFTWTEGWATDNDPTNVLMLVSDETWYPTVLAEVTPTGFTAIEVLGGQPIILGCGGSPDFTGSVWSGWNIGSTNQGGAIDPTEPAQFITPTGTLADWVRVVDRTGNGQHESLTDWLERNDRRYYYEALTTQPWVQDGADFGAAADGNVHGHVTRTDNYYADATITFVAEATVTTPGTGAPQFFVREVFQSLDPEFNNWYWGWSNPTVRVSVHGTLGGLPFVGFVDRDGNILDADGSTISRVIQTGDHLIGTVTGVFQND